MQTWSRDVTDDYRRLMRSQPHFALLPDAERHHLLEVVAPTLEALEAIGALRWGAETVYEVTVDDPDMTQRYRYKITAFSAYAAALEGTRRAIREDPSAGMPQYLTRGERDALAAENPDVVEAVALYTTVVRDVPERIREAVEITTGRER